MHIGQFQIPLQSCLIGDPFDAPILQRTSLHQVGHGLNVIDQTDLATVAALESHCEEAPVQNPSEVTDTCGRTMSYITSVGGSLMSYDARVFNKDFNPYKKNLNDYLNN